MERFGFEGGDRRLEDVQVEGEEGKRASALVAPLNIQKSPRTAQNREPGHTRQSSSGETPSVTSQSHSQSQPSPPLTPKTSQDSLGQVQPVQTVFHDYLRAFYHFHPASTVSSSTDESSITVPINQGDVILVHSVHPNGWADGTILSTGSRGWLPTNYCEPYDHAAIRKLLYALTHLWGLVRDAENGDLIVFTKQDYVRIMIAGVRYFLEKTQCLTRDSSTIVAHVGLRRMRKGLLGDLSSLVKTAKRLQDALQTNNGSSPVFEYLDEVVLKSFKLVTRAVRFLDIWAQHSVCAACDLSDTRNSRPLTPPSDSIDSSVQPTGQANQRSGTQLSANEYALSVLQANTTANLEEPVSASTHSPCNVNRLSVAFSMPEESDRQHLPLAPRPSAQANRSSVTHRLSYTAKLQGEQKRNLASERLNTTHDAFLGFIGSFIGLHLQSRSSDELTLTTQQSVIACRRLLAVVEEIWKRDSRRSTQLAQARDTMLTRLSDLVQATKNIFSTSDTTPTEDVLMPDSEKRLVSAATCCVRSAGDCVTKARLAIERLGDFELEHGGLGLSESVFKETCPAVEPVEISLSCSPSGSVSEKIQKLLPAPQPDPSHVLPLSRAESKPLPDVPLPSPSEDNKVNLEPLRPAFVQSAAPVSVRTSKSSLPPLSHGPPPHFPQPCLSELSQSPASATHRFFSKSARTDSVNASVADSSSTFQYSVRGDAASVISQVSTRATTPEHSPSKKQSSQTLVSSFGSSSELRSFTSEDVLAVEEHLLETTYAHELIYNKDGQISGGSLRALVEQLTTHESNPDAMFVTAFYLTFRLFTTPVNLAQCLISRFDSVGDNLSVGTPVRLRIYNVFKGWLESYWVAESDAPALGIILAFATGRLRTALPAAGKRLAELTSKVTEVHAGAPVPRLVSAIGKAHVCTTADPSADSNVPNPVITKSQLSLLRSAKEGKAQCGILDFDPLELARQLTLIESKLFCAIQPEELFASVWTKKSGSKAANVRAMSTLANDLDHLVTDTILTLEDAKKRAVTIKHWVKIAQRCLDLNNYHSLMAIVCTLNSSPVLRLKKTWEIVSAKTKGRFEELKAIIDVNRNYAVLRQKLRDHNGPCIPYIGIYLTDLTFVDAGNENMRQLPGEPGHESVSVINFDKYMKAAKILGQLQSFQLPYRLARVPEMQEWMESQTQRVHLSDQANMHYYRRSLLLEPRTPPHPVKASSVESGAHSTLSVESRNSSKERFDFLNFHFASANTSRER